MLHVVLEVSLVFDPSISQPLQVAAIEFFFQNLDGFVVEHSVTVQLVLPPLALIGNFATRVVEHSSSLHAVFHPLSAIFAPVRVVERPEAMTHTVLLIALVSAFREGFAHIFWKFSSARFGVDLLVVGGLLPVTGWKIASVGLLSEGSFAIGVTQLHSGVPISPVHSYGLLILVQNLLVFH
jgi:hypothetical protein